MSNCSRLTAFVLKVFSKARSLGGVVDVALLDGMVKFLYTQQVQGAASGGKFKENYRVIHREMIVRYLIY